jgi:putative ABC transport system permease protein
VAEVDPALPVTRVQTLDARVAAALKEDRFNLMLIGSFAAIGIVLAAVGIYGAMACAVRERTREFGVRLALGQPPRALIRATLWQSARLGVAGAALGLVVVFILARILGDALYLVRGSHSGLLYGVTTTDPMAIAAGALALVGIATLAGVLPAREATRIDPLIALRQE